MGFFEYIAQHWYVGVALVLLIVLTAFVWMKALISSKKRSEERERIIAELEREKAIRKEFKNINELTFEEGKDNYGLIVGMCAHIQQILENKEDMNLAFEQLTELERNIYTLGYVFEDSKNALSEFFRANGEPLLSAAVKAVKEVVGGEFSELFCKEAVMLDENDETTSVDNTVLEKTDDEFRVLMNNKCDYYYAKVAAYIRENKDFFLA